MTKKQVTMVTFAMVLANLTKSEQYLQRLAFFRAFAVEREYLEMIGQKESKYRTYILSLYNDVLLAESLIIEPEDE